MTDFPNLALPLDANGRPVFGDSAFWVEKQITTNASNATATPALFTVIGSVLITKLFGVVVTDLGSNHTIASLRINDQTAQVYLTAVGGTTLSAIKAGSLIVKTGLVAAAITKIDNVAGAVAEPTTIQTLEFSPVIVTKKTGALTQIEYRYATTQTPTTGAIKFKAAFLPLSDDGDLVAV